MKCTHCGSTNVIKTEFKMKACLEGIPKIPDFVDVYMCLECSHHDFYSMKKAELYKSTLKKINKAQEKIKDLQNDIDILQSPKFSQNLNEEIKNIEEKLKSEKNTKEELHEFKKNKNELQTKLTSIPNDIKVIRKDINKLNYFIKEQTELLNKIVCN